MDEQRLAQIEEDIDLEVCGIEPGYWADTVTELIAEVRRLQAWQQAAIAWGEMMMEKYPKP